MNECNIVRDLLPLYAEELTSPDSGEFIEKHLASCESCRETWRRYREELPKMEVAENMATDYKKGIQKDKLKLALATCFGWLLVAAIVVGVYLYCGWEKGDFAKGTVYFSPDGVRSVELASLADTGFFGNEGGILRFRFERGFMNRYPVDWQDVTVHWAPDSQTMLLDIENGAGERELRLVNHKGGLPDGGTREIPGLYPSEEEPDLSQVLTDFCAGQGVNASDFQFEKWSDDSWVVYFRYDSEDGSGLLEYDLDTKTVRFHVAEIPVAPVERE